MVQLDPRSGCYQIRNANSTVHMNFDAAKLSKFTEFWSNTICCDWSETQKKGEKKNQKQLWLE